MCNRTRVISKCLCVLPLFVTFSSIVLSQTAEQEIADRGVEPNQSYSSSQTETVDSTSGNVSLSIPLASLPQGRAGSGGGVSLNYNSSLYDVQPNSSETVYTVIKSPYGNWRYGYEFGLSLETQPGSCVEGTPPSPPTLYRLHLAMPDGSSKVLYLRGQSVAWDGFTAYKPDGTSCVPNTGRLSGPLTYFTADGSFLRLEMPVDSTGNTPWTSQQWTLYFPNGTQVTGINQQTSKITDHNGNALSVVNLKLSDGNPATRLVDDLGRYIQIENAPNQDFITYPGFSASLQVTVNWTTASGSFSYSCGTQNGQTCSATMSFPVVSSISLPAAYSGGPSPSYSFGYNTGTSGKYDELNSLVLPSGAQAQYAYTEFTSSVPQTSSPPLISVNQKTLSYTATNDGATSQVSEVTKYSFQSNMSIITDPTGFATVSYFNGTGMSSSQSSLIYQVVRPDNSRIERLWYNNTPYGTSGYDMGNPYVELEIRSVTDASGNPTRSAATTYSYDKNGNLLQTTEYDWGTYSNIPRDSYGRITGPPSDAAVKRVTTASYVVTTQQQAGTGSETVNDDANAYWNPAAPVNLQPVARVVVSGSGPGAATEYSYNGNANVTQVRRWDSTKASSLPSSLNSSNATIQNSSFDVHGNLTSTTDARGVTTSYTYDGNDLYLTEQVQNSNGAYYTLSRTSTYVFDANTGLVTSVTDADNNVATTYGYDWLGRPTLMTEASNTGLARETQVSYEDQPQNLRVVVKRDQNSKNDAALVTVTDYDPLGRVRLTRQLESTSQGVDDDTTGIKVQTRYQYSPGALNVLVSNPYRSATSTIASNESTMGWTVNQIDALGRLAKTQTFDGSGLPAPWGSNGNSTGTVTTSFNAQTSTVTDQAKNARQLTVDGLGRLAQVTEDPGGLNYGTSYNYDALNNLTQVAQGSQTRSFTFDSLGRMSQSSEPEPGKRTYAYDAGGNMTSITGGVNKQRTYAYDAFNRLIQINYSDGTPTVSYTYDGANVPYGRGQVTQVSNTNSVTGYFGYDALGRVTGSTQQIGSQTYSFAYAYNLAGGLISETYPSGRVVTTGYDGANRQNQVLGTLAGQGKSYVTNGSYTAHGAPTLYTYGNNVWPFIMYNNRLQPNQLYALKNNDTNQYLYYFWLNWGSTSNNGNLLQFDEEISSTPVPYSSLTTYGQNFGYDHVNRLVSASDATGSTTNWSRTFAYDQYGNGWLSSTPQGIGYGPATPAGNVYNSTNRIPTSSYDDQGNMTNMPPSYTMTYDAENRQITLSNNGSLAASYVYDGLGQRVEKVVGGQTTTYVYDAFGKLAAEYAATPASAPCATCYLSYDHLGSLRLVTDGSGNIIARHDFLPFGEEIPGGAAGRSSQFGPGLDNVNQKFTGQERDSESLFDFFKTRYTNPGLIGRFLSPDPAGAAAADPSNPQSWNQYAYVWGNPLNATDPSGMACYPLELKLAGGCGPQEGVNFGSTWNEFEVSQIPIRGWSYVTPIPISTQLPVMPEGWQVTASISFNSYWASTIVGQGIDIFNLVNQMNASTPVPLIGSPGAIVIRPQSPTDPGRISQYEYGPDGIQQYRYDWGDPHGGRTTDPHLHFIDPSRSKPSSPPIDVPPELAPPKPWTPDGPYSTYPKGSPPILTSPTINFDVLLPVCISCEIMMRLNPYGPGNQPAGSIIY